MQNRKSGALFKTQEAKEQKQLNILRKLSKLQLLELLADQEREIQALKRELEEKNAILAQRVIILDEAGSIAEAALKLNGVFEVAQRTADQYLESLMELQRRKNDFEEDNKPLSSEEK